MRVLSRVFIVTCAVWGGLLAALVGAGPAAAVDKDLASALRAGGLVIVVRHGATAPDQADNDMLHPKNGAGERQLNDQGKAQARAFGEALRQLGAPVGKVYTSQFNRAYETAVLAGFKDIEKTVDLAEGGLDVSPDETARRANALRSLLATPPRQGTDTLLVTHKPNIVNALGKSWSNVEEGEASIFRPENGTAKLIARVRIDEWARIAAAR